VLLLDDGSTDATADIAGSFGFVDYRRQDDLEMDEGRDRTALYRWALELEPEWILTLDGDEALAPGAAEQILRAVEMVPASTNIFEMILAVMATPPDVNAPKRFSGPSPLAFWKMGRAFRVKDADVEYSFTSKHENNLHCGCVPKMLRYEKIKLNACILYYGYESPEAVEKKRAFYGEHDPANLPRVEMLWRERAKCGRAAIGDRLDAREMGITGTVTF
jgi:glycosyltransferase involved in cell wall biosynthesis